MAEGVVIDIDNINTSKYSKDISEIASSYKSILQQLISLVVSTFGNNIKDAYILSGMADPEYVIAKKNTDGELSLFIW